MASHPIVAVGASGGGLEPLRRITERLPRNSPVTVFVVMHSGTASFLPEILSWHGKLRVEFAPGGRFHRVWVHLCQPPDHHMGVDARHIRLSQDPGYMACVRRSIPCSLPSPAPMDGGSWASC